MNELKIKTDRKGQAYVIIGDNSIIHVKNANFEGFALKYKIGNTFYYQGLMLGIRAGARLYFSAAKLLYQYIKANKLTDQTFRKLAV